MIIHSQENISTTTQRESGLSLMPFRFPRPSESIKNKQVASEPQGQEDLSMPGAIASFGAKAESVVSANSPEQITTPRTLSQLTTPL